jgi:hypothetical protein
MYLQLFLNDFVYKIEHVGTQSEPWGAEQIL